MVSLLQINEGEDDEMGRAYGTNGEEMNVY
jgi:hypothetical protein